MFSNKNTLKYSQLNINKDFCKLQKRKKYMKIYLLIVSIILVISSSLSSQSFIQGKVFDKITNEPLPAVNIYNEKNIGISSDFKGKYKLEIPPGEHIITYNYIGYKKITKEIKIKENEILEINCGLVEKSMEIGTVIVSAGKFEQKIEEITVSVEVIKPNLIENKNTTEIQTAMEQIPGVNMTDGQANIRGGSGWSYGTGTRVLVLVDDMPMVDGGLGQAQWSAIPTENISQVEVIKGAASALYGSSALNGIINIRTKYPSLKPETKIKIHYGYYDNPQNENHIWWSKNPIKKGTDFLHSRKINNLDLTIGAFILEDQGYRYGESKSRKRFNFNTRYKNQIIKGLSYGVNGNFMLNETYDAIIWESYENPFYPLDGDVISINGNVNSIDPFINYYNDKKKYRLSLNTRYLQVFHENVDEETLTEERNHSDLYYMDMQYQKNVDKINLNFTLGTANDYVFSNVEEFGGKNYRSSNSVYAQLDKKFGERLNTSIGSRFEIFGLTTDSTYIINGDSINTYYESKPVIRAGLNYKISESSYIRTSFGQGFRFPSIAELFVKTEIAKGIFVYPNPQLRSESGWSSELALKQVFKINNWMGFFDVAGFLMEYDDMMEFTFGAWGDDLSNPDEFFGLGFKQVNIGKTRISGIEVSINGTGKIGASKVNLLGGYSYINPVSLDRFSSFITDAGGNEMNYVNSSSADSINVLKYRHEHTAKFDIELINNKISQGLSLRYNSFMKNVDKIFTTDLFAEIVPGVNESRLENLTGDIIIDYRFAYSINNNMSLSVIVNNVLNKLYQSRPCSMMPMRNINFQFKIKI